MEGRGRGVEESRSLNDGFQSKGGVSQRIDFRSSWSIGKVEVKGDLVMSRREGFTLVSAPRNFENIGLQNTRCRYNHATREKNRVSYLSDYRIILGKGKVKADREDGS